MVSTVLKERLFCERAVIYIFFEYQIIGKPLQKKPLGCVVPAMPTKYRMGQYCSNHSLSCVYNILQVYNTSHSLEGVKCQNIKMTATLAMVAMIRLSRNLNPSVVSKRALLVVLNRDTVWYLLRLFIFSGKREKHLHHSNKLL